MGESLSLSKSTTAARSLDLLVGRGHGAGCRGAPVIWEDLIRFFLLSGDRVTLSNSELGRPHRARQFFGPRTQGVALGYRILPL